MQRKIRGTCGTSRGRVTGAAAVSGVVWGSFGGGEVPGRGFTPVTVPSPPLPSPAAVPLCRSPHSSLSTQILSCLHLSIRIHLCISPSAFIPIYLHLRTSIPTFSLIYIYTYIPMFIYLCLYICTFSFSVYLLFFFLCLCLFFKSLFLYNCILISSLSVSSLSVSAGRKDKPTAFLFSEQFS